MHSYVDIKKTQFIGVIALLILSGLLNGNVFAENASNLKLLATIQPVILIGFGWLPWFINRMCRFFVAVV